MRRSKRLIVGAVRPAWHFVAPRIPAGGRASPRIRHNGADLSVSGCDMPANDFVIERLTPDASLLSVVSAWTYGAWGPLNPEKDSAAWQADIAADAGSGGVPSVFVAQRAGRAVGTASLVARDMTIRPALTPWLASVFVPSAERGRGIASALVRRVENEARADGITRFYLYTPDQQRLYARLGWRTSESLIYRGEQVTIMTRDL